MRPDQLKWGRESAGLTQQRAAARLGVSQAYLSLLESGQRRVTEQLGSQAAELYRLPATALPIEDDMHAAWDSGALAGALADLGYQGFRQLRGRPQKNPAVVLLAALSASDLEVRVIEALPWLVVHYDDLDWEWLIHEVKQRNLQNRLGFVVTLGRRLAEKCGLQAVSRRLRQNEEIVDRARLAREDTLCQDSLSGAERRWLRNSRPDTARYWNLLTDLDSENLTYAG